MHDPPTEAEWCGRSNANREISVGIGSRRVRARRSCARATTCRPKLGARRAKSSGPSVAAWT
eukprot:3412644-Pyramimonas_sp.AAC.1